MTASVFIERVVEFVQLLGVARNRDFEEAGINPRYVAEALKAGAIERVGRGTYAPRGKKRTHQELIVEACKRVPHGVVCLASALWFHGLITDEPEALWMMIDTKARVPRIDWFPVEFVFASGDALTQGVMNLAINGAPIRVYSPMKTVTDCFKYADKIGEKLGPIALQSAVNCNKYNRQRLLRFADICRVKLAVSICERARKSPESIQSEGESTAPPARVWDRDKLAKEVWEKPIRQLAKEYGTSDVAIHKHCKKMGIELPGRGYWAQKV